MVLGFFFFQKKIGSQPRHGLGLVEIDQLGGDPYLNLPKRNPLKPLPRQWSRTAGPPIPYGNHSFFWFPPYLNRIILSAAETSWSLFRVRRCRFRLHGRLGDSLFFVFGTCPTRSLGSLCFLSIQAYDLASLEFLALTGTNSSLSILFRFDRCSRQFLYDLPATPFL